MPSLSIYAYSESISYPFITEYIGTREGISIPIKIHSSARKDENQSSEPEMKSNPQDFPEREMPKFPANKAESYNKKIVQIRENRSRIFLLLHSKNDNQFKN